MYIKVIDLTQAAILGYLPTVATFASTEKILRHLLLFACRHIGSLRVCVCACTCTARKEYKFQFD